MATKEDFSKNQGPETNTEKMNNESGVYRHAESGVEKVVINDPLYGSAADAYVRLGFERVGDVPASYYEETALAVASANPKPATSPDALAGIEARLKLLEKENAELKAEAGSAAPAETPTKVDEAPEETVEAPVEGETFQVDGTNDGTETVTSQTNDPEVETVTTSTALGDMTLDELYSVAAEEKVRGYSLYKSTEKLVDAIEQNRSEKGTK